MSLAKDMKQLFDEMEKAGFRVTPHDGSRMRVIAPTNDMRFLPSQPTIRSSVRNARSWAKRNGLVVVEPPVKPLVPKPSQVFPKGVARLAKASTAPAAEVVELGVYEPEEAKEIPVPATPPEPAVRAVSKRRSGPDLDSSHPAYPLPDSPLVDKGNGVWHESMRPIGPHLALAMLEYNERNRGVQERLVDSWARTMSEGGWVEENGDPIRFADTGRLLDGQKRLKSVVKSGATVRFDIITGLPESAQDVMDSGQHRSVANQLRINGFANNMVVAAASRLLWLWDHDALISGNPAPSNAEQLDYVLELMTPEASIEESASLAATQANRRLLAPSVIAACHWRMCRADREAANDFWHQFGTGAISSEVSPILALRETMLRRRELGSKPRQAEQVYLACRAWVLWRRGQDAKRLQLPKDGLKMSDIPVIV